MKGNGWRAGTFIGICAIFLSYISSPINPDPFIFQHAPPKLEGVLEPNTKLQHAEKLFEGILNGPESVTVDKKGVLYTGTQEGQIWALDGNNAKVIAHTGINSTQCGSFDYEPACGRPQGMAFHPDGSLYVADTYKGLLKVDMNTGEVQTILTEMDEKPFKFTNAVDVSPVTGLVYFTDSSSKWDRRHYTYEVIETNRLGRLIEYNPVTGKSRLLLDDLYLANGVAVAHDGSFVLVAEMSVCRVRKYYLNGPKMSQSEAFLDNYPGYPDNIRRTSKGNFFIGSPVSRFNGQSLLGPFMDLVGPYPWIKKIVASILPFSIYNSLIPKHAIALEVDNNGNILRSFHDPDGKVILGGMSEVFQHGDFVYIGNFRFNFLGRIHMRHLISDNIKQ